jgi:hypothetical protein
MRKGRQEVKKDSQKVRRLQQENYPPVEEWPDALNRFEDLLLKDGEYTVIVDPHTGMGLYLVAKLNNSVRCTAYLDGTEFKGEFKRITSVELKERNKEQEKFL